jgi:hypothetical protein
MARLYRQCESEIRTGTFNQGPIRKQGNKVTPLWEEGKKRRNERGRWQERHVPYLCTADQARHLSIDSERIHGVDLRAHGTNVSTTFKNIMDITYVLPEHRSTHHHAPSSSSASYQSTYVANASVNRCAPGAVRADGRMERCTKLTSHPVHAKLPTTHGRVWADPPHAAVTHVVSSASTQPAVAFWRTPMPRYRPRSVVQLADSPPMMVRKGYLRWKSSYSWSGCGVWTWVGFNYECVHASSPE